MQHARRHRESHVVNLVVLQSLVDNVPGAHRRQLRIREWSGGKLIEMETVEQLASNYILGIQKIQPKGPYRIAGYSFGAVVALEIAQQLHALNEPVEQLFVVCGSTHLLKPPFSL